MEIEGIDLLWFLLRRRAIHRRKCEVFPWQVDVANSEIKQTLSDSSTKVSTPKWKDNAIQVVTSQNAFPHQLSPIGIKTEQY